MKRNLLRTMLLAAVALTAGANLSYAQITAVPMDSTCSFSGGSFGPFSGGAIKDGTKVSGVLDVNNTTATATFKIGDNESAYTLSENELVTISYTGYHGWLTGSKAATVSLINSGKDTLVSYVYNVGSCQITSVKLGGVEQVSSAFSMQSKYSSSKNANGLTGNGKQPYVTTEGYNPAIAITVAQSGIVGVSFTLNGSTTSYSATLKNVTMDLASFSIKSTTTNEDRGYCIDDFTIASETAVQYTLKGVCGETELYTTTCFGKAGDNVGTVSTDAYYDSNNKKYIYSSDDSSSKTIANDGTTVVTVTYTEASTYSYTVKAVDSESAELATIASGSDFEGESVKVPYGKYIDVNGTLYSTSATSSQYNYTFTLSSDNQSETITYTKGEDVVYFSEGEEINSGENITVVSTGNAATRCSQSKAGYASSDVVLTTLPAGQYLLTACIFSPSSAGSTFYFKAGDETALTFTTVNSNATTCTGNIVVGSNTEITLVAGGGTNAAVDYLYIQKTGDVVTKTLTSTGYASFSSTNSVSVPSDVTVYTAKVKDDNSAVVLTAISDGTNATVVPANTGVILYKDVTEATTVTMAVTTETATADFTSNQLLATSDASYTTVPSEGTYYALSASAAEFGVLKNGITLSADKAYIKAPASSAKTLAITFGDETTGIGEVKAAAAESGVYYNLSGQRVAQPTKGLYIVKGKKVIVK